ncbi:MAG: CHRD domain-containing protein [Cyanobacteria bacterium]|nr:CHRD domain-containing protein [Cyanobacteriota bacterium]
MEILLGTPQTPFDIIQGTPGNDIWNFSPPLPQQIPFIIAAQASPFPDLLLLLDGDDLAANAGNARILSGNRGNDTLIGSDGNDTLLGGKDSDILIGGSGDDALYGDLGNDILTGGAGRDHFHLSSADPLPTIDVITDFTDGEDHIHLPTDITFNDLILEQIGGDVRITPRDPSGTPRNTALLLQNTLLGTLEVSDFMGTASGGHHMGGGSDGHGAIGRVADTNTPPLNIDLNPAQGDSIGFAYEAFLSPQQEPGEEEDTPPLTPEQFKSTEPSTPRNERLSRGHGILRFSNDLSKAYVDVEVENIDINKISMFHIHCGLPDQLGPIMVNFDLMGDVQENFRDDGRFSLTILNEDIENTTAAGEGIVGAFTAGCPIIPGLPDKVKTIAGMYQIAQKGELYFNLHTTSQTYFGDVRGKLNEIDVSKV